MEIRINLIFVSQFLLLRNDIQNKIFNIISCISANNIFPWVFVPIFRIYFLTTACILTTTSKNAGRYWKYFLVVAWFTLQREFSTKKYWTFLSSRQLSAGLKIDIICWIDYCRLQKIENQFRLLLVTFQQIYWKLLSSRQSSLGLILKINLPEI